MTTTAASWSAALPARLAAGIAGGLVGRMMFGALMQMIGMISMVAMLVGSTYELILGVAYALTRPDYTAPDHLRRGYPKAPASIFGSRGRLR
jgi:predicted lipid-binding transport protein (Tim44 family)